MSDEITQQPQAQESRNKPAGGGSAFGGNQEPRKKTSWLWITILIILLAIGGFFLLKGGNDPSTQNRIDAFFTLDKIVRTDIPEVKLAEYKNRMADAKTNSNSPEGDINFRSYMEAGSVKKGVGDYEGARDIWEYVNEKRPKNSVSFANLGDLYANFLKDPEKAEQNYLTAIENDPADPAYLRALLELYQYQLTSRLGFQESFFVKATEANVENPDFWLILAGYYELAKNYEKSIEAWKEISTIDQNQKELVNREVSRIQALTK